MSDNDNKKGGTPRSAAVIGMLVAFIGGYLLGDLTGGDKQQARAGKATNAKRKHVPVGSSPVKGSGAAAVTIVEFADFQCGYCARSVQVQRRLLRQFPGRVRWVYKHFPLPERIHPHAKLAAQASLAARSQGQFWEFHDRLYKNQKNMKLEDLLAHARMMGLDMDRFQKELESKQHVQAVEADVALARTLKVAGTPNFFINGRHFSGSMSASRLERVVKEELAHAQQLVRAGTNPTNLYEELTREKAEGEGQANKGAAKGAKQPEGPRPHVAPKLLRRVSPEAAPRVAPKVAPKAP
jgi:protein-disulfide isomerase